MKEIQLSQQGKNKGKYFAMVDDEDFDRINKLRWAYCRKLNSPYALRIIANIATYMHRLIMNTPNGMEVDHIDHNGLNNQKSNLRNCTHSQNCINRPIPKKKTSKYLGVSYNKEMEIWRAFIYKDNKSIYLGKFENEIYAAMAYNVAAEKHHGVFARINIL